MTVDELAASVGMPFMCQSARGARTVGILALQQQLKFFVRLLPQVLRLLELCPLHLNPVDPPTLVVPVVGLGLVARVLVVPVDQVDFAAGAPLHVDRPEVL